MGLRGPDLWGNADTAVCFRHAGTDTPRTAGFAFATPLPASSPAQEIKGSFLIQLQVHISLYVEM